MSPFQVTGLVVVLCLIGTVVAIVYRALRCRSGWRVWFLDVVARWYSRLMFRRRSNRPCPFPRNTAAIVVANHTSPVDPILVWAEHSAKWPPHQQRPIGYMMAKEFYEKRGPVGWVCRAMESIPVQRAGRDMSAVRAALRRLKENKWLGLFPEGRINKTPEKGFLPANTGVAYLALRARVPVYPVFIHDAPRGRTMVRCFLKRTRAKVTYGVPIELYEKFDPDDLTADALRAATAHVMETLTELQHDRWFEQNEVPSD